MEAPAENSFPEKREAKIRIDPTTSTHLPSGQKTIQSQSVPKKQYV